MTFEQDASDVARFDTALAQDVSEYETMAQRSVSIGQLLTAIEIARDGLLRFGKTKILQQQLALALAQTGALDAAQEVLAELRQGSAQDEETLSLLGRVHKELWRRAPEAAGAAAALQKACAYYREAFAVSSKYYPGINLAFTLAASGDFTQAGECARKVAAICRTQIKEGGANKVDGWLVATLAEALVHQGENAEAAPLYRQAAGIFNGRWRDIASMRRQAGEILRFISERPAGPPARGYDLSAISRRARGWLGRTQPGEKWLDQCFDFPSVVVFSGHMIDHPGRTPPRFPPEREAAVREQIRLHLLQIRAGVGYSSAAAGGDIIFCECLLEMEAKVNLVLPCSVEAFKRQSVSFAGPDWERRFHHVLANCNSCIAANPTGNAATAPQAATPTGLVYANRIATGLAALQARALDLELQAVALWDGRPGNRPGGTASVVHDWERQHFRPHIIRPDSSDPSTDGPGAGAAPAPAGEAAPPIETPLVRQEIKAMLFAQVMNFQLIAEDQMPAFVEHFKGAIANVMAERSVRPVIAESSGGVHFFVCDDCEDAGGFALAVRDRIVKTPWAQHGLPATLGIRILLHAGPVFTFIDPTLGRLTCAGAHVNRAARIEALAPRNQVYVTQEFAALCGAERVSSLTFEYLGFLRTTMMFEDAALYRLDRGKEEPAAVGTGVAAGSGKTG